MDSSLLQLFTTEEILERLSEKEQTGMLHVFTPRESVNIFLREGFVIGAVKGLVEGEEILEQALEWKDGRFLWQPNSVPETTLAKPMEFLFSDFLMLRKTKPRVAISGKLGITKTRSMKAPSAPEGSAFHISLPTTAATTGPVEIDRVRTRSAEAKTDGASSASPLTATKNFQSGSKETSAHEAALLSKFRLALVSAEEGNPMRFRLTRIGNLAGRNPACDVIIKHGSVSRQHCLLQITDRGLHVKDLGTTNGTKVNGIVLTEGYINVGDKLTIGHLVFTLEKDAGEG